MTTTYATRLRRVPMNRYAPKRHERPVTYRVRADEYDDHPAVVEVPSPFVLARDFLVPALADKGKTMLADGKAIVLVDTDGHERRIPLETLADMVIGTLSRVDDDHDTVASLRLLMTSKYDAHAYATEVVRSARAQAKPWRKPEPVKPKAPAMTPLERLHRHRENLNAAEDEAIREFLDTVLDDEEMPAHIAATALYAQAVETISDWQDDEPTMPEGHRLRRNRFYAIADEVLGPRARVGADGVRSYRLTRVVTAEVDDMLLGRADRRQAVAV